MDSSAARFRLYSPTSFSLVGPEVLKFMKDANTRTVIDLHNVSGYCIEKFIHIDICIAPPLFPGFIIFLWLYLAHGICLRKKLVQDIKDRLGPTHIFKMACFYGTIKEHFRILYFFQFFSTLNNCLIILVLGPS